MPKGMTISDPDLSKMHHYSQWEVEGKPTENFIKISRQYQAEDG